MLTVYFSRIYCKWQSPSVSTTGATQAVSQALPSPGGQGLCAQSEFCEERRELRKS